MIKRAVIIRILIFITLSLGTALLLRPFQTLLFERMERTRDGLITQAEEILGRKIIYSSMGPSIFGVLDIRDIHVLRDDGSIVLSISRLRLSYSLWEFLKGNFSNVFHMARIDRPILRLDYQKDDDLILIFSNLTGQINGNAEAGVNGETGVSGLLPDMFSLRILNGELEFSGENAGFFVQGFRFEASTRDGIISFQSNWDAGAEFSVLEGIRSNVGMGGTLNGQYYEELGEGSASLSLLYLSGETFSFRPIDFAFSFSGRSLEMRKTRDLLPFTLSLSYEFDNGDFNESLSEDFSERLSERLSVRFMGENFILGDLITFNGDLAVFNPLLSVRISGNGNMDYALGDLSYSLDFQSHGIANAFTGVLSLDIRAEGDSEGINISLLDIQSSYGNLEFYGGLEFAPVSPYGSLSFSDLRRHGTEGLSGSFVFNTHNAVLSREINMSGNLDSGGIQFSSLHAQLLMEEDDMSFNISARKYANPQPGQNQSRIMFEGFMDNDSMNGNNHFQVNARLDSVFLSDITAYVEPLVFLPFIPPFINNIFNETIINTEVFFETDFNQFLYHIPLFSASYNEIASVSASISGTNRRLDLNTGRISWNGSHVDITSFFDIEDINDISFTLSAYYRDLTYNFYGVFLDYRQLSLIGSYGFHAFFSFADDGILSGYVLGENVPFASGYQHASLNFMVSLHYENPNNWEAGIERFEISRLNTPASSQASLALMGKADESGLSISSFLYNDGLGELQGNLNLLWDSSFANLDLQVYASSIMRNEFYFVRAIYIDNDIDLMVNTSGMQLSRFTNFNAIINGEFNLHWESMTSFNASANLSSYIMAIPGNIIHLSLDANMDNDILFLEEININGFGLEAVISEFKIDRLMGVVNTQALLFGNLGDIIPVNVSFGTNAGFNNSSSKDNSSSWLDLLNNFSGITGVLAIDNARYGSMNSDGFNFDFSFQNESEGVYMAVNGGPSNMLRFIYTPTPLGGSYSASLSSPFPVRGSVSGTLENGNLDAYASNFYVDMSSLWNFFPPDLTPVRFPEGLVAGSFRIGGTLTDPEFYGSLRATGVHIVIPEFIPEPIRPVAAVFTLEGYDFWFGPVDAVVGQGANQGAGQGQGWFRFDQWIPNTLRLDIEVPSSTPIPSAFDLAGVVADGQVSGTLIIVVDNFLVNIIGDLVVNDTEVTLNFDELRSFTYDVEPKNFAVLSDFTIRAGRRVSFFWPNMDFPVLQANADLGTGIRVLHDNSSGRYSINGDINLRSGEFFYLERNFYLREGTLFFRETESSFDPRISARAEMRDHNQHGSVIISMIIDYSPLFSFSPRFISSPPLSQQEIYGILGHFPPEGSEGSNISLATGVILDSLAQFYLLNRVQREVRNFLGLDMLSVRTQFVQNFVLQPEYTTTFGNYFDNTTVYIGRYFSPDIFGELMLTFRLDELNPSAGVRLEPQVGVEFRGPLFDIRLDVAPQNYRNWFLDDISFSIFWRRTF